MLLICQHNSSTLPFKMQQDTVGMWAPLTYVMLCWERIPTRIQLNRHLKSKIKSSICHFAVFPQPKVISNCTLPFVPRTSPIQKDQMAPEICLSEILALAVIINMEIERTGQYASKPSTFSYYFYQCICRHCLWVTSKNWTFSKESWMENLLPSSIHKSQASLSMLFPMKECKPLEK